MRSVTTAATPGTILILAIAALMALLLSGCGGGGTSVPVDDTNNQDTFAPGAGGQQDTGGPAAGGTVEDSEPPAGGGGSPTVKFGTMLPLGSPLPAVPSDDEKASSKTVSTILDYPGADFMLAAGGTVDGDDLLLESTDEFTAWAMYRAEGLADLDIEIYSIEALPGDLGQNYEVAFSEFVSDDWVFLINSTLPEAEVNLAEADGQFISALGNLYFLVTVDGGDSVRISVSHLLTADENPDDPPGQDPPVPFTHFGPLLEMGDAAFSISNEQGLATTFSFDEETLWFGIVGEPISPTSLMPGDLLMVEALETSAGWYALIVALVERGGGGDPGDPGKTVFFEGEIVAIGDGQLLIKDPNPRTDGGETLLDYNEDTQWFTKNGPGSPGDFAPGDLVFIEAVLTDSGILALSVLQLSPGDPGDPGVPLVYVGEITELGPQLLVLDGDVAFTHDDSTVWMNDGGPASWQDFSPGDLVHVEAEQTEAGLRAAVVLDLGRNSADIAFLTGVIASIGDGQIMLDDGIVIAYNEHTVWYDEFLNEVGPGEFAAGDRVYIVALAFTGDLLAAYVFKLPEDPSRGGGGSGGGGDPGR